MTKHSLSQVSPTPPDPIDNESFTWVEMLFTAGIFSYRVTSPHPSPGEVASLWVVGLAEVPTTVLVEEEEWGQWQVQEVGGRGYLHITGLNLAVDQDFTVQLLS